MIQPSMLVIIPRMKERTESEMATPYMTLLLVKYHILRCGQVQFRITLAYLYTCLVARYNCVIKAASAVPIGVNMYGQCHAPTLRVVRRTFEKRHIYSHARAVGLP